MRKNTTKNATPLTSGKLPLCLSVSKKVLACLLGLLFSSMLFAQTFPTSCTSKDLTLLQASLPAPANNRCICSGSRVLILGIRNGTNSTRTSFALWGTLVRKDASGNITSSQPIFACANNVKGKTSVPNGDNYLPASTIEIQGVPVSTNAQGQPVIQVNCGESLDIINMHLAWTTSNANETCDVLKNNPSLINPKCGTQALISVGVGVDAAITSTQATCSAGGKLRVTPSGGLPPYEVSLDGGNYVPVPANPGYHEFTGVTGGQHTVVIRDNTSKPVAERCSATKTPSVASTNPPTAGIQANRTTVTCANPSATLTASGGTTYSWSDGNGEVGTNAALTVTPTISTTYTVTVTDANGCTDTETQLITVDKGAPTAGITANRTTVTCANPSATLTASGGGSYSWSPGGATTAEITVSPTSNTTYTVTVTGSNGCTAQASQLITASKTPPTAAISANRTTVTCTDQSATLTASGGVSYSWSDGSSEVGTNAILNVTPTTNTTYTVTVTGANGCTDTESQQVMVNKTLPSFTVCITQPSLCSSTGSVTFNAIGSNLKYSIDNGTNYQTGNSFTNLGSGSVTGFKVLNTATGCVSSAACDTEPQCESEEKTARNGVVSEQAIELLSKQSERVKAFPNPFSDRIRFSLKSDVSGQASLELYNMMGQKIKTVFQGQIRAGQVQNIEYAVPVHQRSNLLYVFRVGGEVTSGKLIGMK
jgi:hypothetical protein